MAKLRYQRPKLATMSPTPTSYNLAQTVAVYNDVIAKLPERVERGRALFLQMMAGLLKQKVQQRAPRILMNGKEMKYAEDLRIALVSGAPDDMDAMAIYLDSTTAVLTEEAAGRTALYVLPHRKSPGWVEVLTKWGPWPAELLPVRLAGQHAKVVARSARPDELRALTVRLGKRRVEILRELEDAGAENPRMERTMYGVGTEVKQDIAHAVLRREFGLDGLRPKSHWRPALRETVEAVPDAMERFNRYVVTGRENVFLLPEVDDQITISQLHDGAPFAREIAPFVPKR